MPNRKSIFFFTGAFVLALGLAFAAGLMKKQGYGTVLKLEDVKVKFGAAAFDEVKFKDGDLKLRATMAHSLIKKSALIGKHADDVFRALGQPDGFFKRDTIPAYLLERRASLKEQQWQLVFLLGPGRKVSEVIVQLQGSDPI